jgi:hypothetical protein
MAAQRTQWAQQLQRTIGNFAVDGLLAPVRQAPSSNAAQAPRVQRMTLPELRTLQDEFGHRAVLWALSAMDTQWEVVSPTAIRQQIEAYGSNSAGRIQHTGSDGDPFKAWRAGGADPAAMNCWEYVLYTAVRLGKLTRTEVQGAYMRGGEDAVKGLFAGRWLPIENPQFAQLAAGDAVTVGVPDRHVLLSLGSSFVADLGSWDKVKVTTLDDVLQSQTNNLRMHVGHVMTMVAALLHRIERSRPKGSVLVDDIAHLHTKLRLVVEHWDDDGSPWKSLAHVRQAVEDEIVTAPALATVRAELDSLLQEVETLKLYRIPAEMWVEGLKALAAKSVNDSDHE